MYGSWTYFRMAAGTYMVNIRYRLILGGRESIGNKSLYLRGKKGPSLLRTIAKHDGMGPHVGRGKKHIKDIMILETSPPPYLDQTYWKKDCQEGGTIYLRNPRRQWHLIASFTEPHNIG